LGNVNHQFLLSLLIILLGYIIKRFKVIPEKDGAGLSNVILYITLPALVLSTFSSIKIDYSLGLLPLINLAYGVLISLLAIYVFKNQERKLRGILSVALPGFNIGMFAYPLAEAIWGEEALQSFAMFDMGNAIILFGVCYLLGCYFSSDTPVIDTGYMANRLLKFVPLQAYIVALLINISGLQLPGLVLDMTKVLAKANMPLCFLVLGIYLDVSFKGVNWKDVFKVIAIRYAFGLAAGLVLYFTMPFSPIFRYTILIGFILPIGFSTIPYANKFGFDPKLASALVNITNILSFLLTWLIVALL